MKMEWHALRPEEVAASLGSDAAVGLRAEDAATRLREFGPNALPKPVRASAVADFFRQFGGTLHVVMFAAAAIAFAAGQHGDAGGILLAVLIDGVAGFVQQRRAEGAIEKLRELEVAEAVVVRDGRRTRVPAADIVSGDLLVLAEGDRVAADTRLASCRELRLAEAALTGESAAVDKSIDAVDASAPLADRTDMAYMGTSVVAGSGVGFVVATGAATAVGAIATTMLSITRERTPFEMRMDRLAGRLGLASIALSAFVFSIGAARGYPLLDMFLFSVAVLVSVIPEGLPAVIAIVLAIGVLQMAKRRVIVRHLPAVETLGSTDVICTDKTGTLTENKMTVRRIATRELDVEVSGEGWETKGDFIAAGARIVPAEVSAIDLLLHAAARCSSASLEAPIGSVGGQVRAVGDPTEAALTVVAAKAGIGVGIERRHVDEIPFSSSRKYRAVLDDIGDVGHFRGKWMFVVGAFETVAERSLAVMDGGQDLPFDETSRRYFENANAELAGRAMRVVAVAAKHAHEAADIGDKDVADLLFLGLVGMSDPPREGVARTIQSCREAGIRIIMITGDHRATAVAVAEEIGLSDGEEGVFEERQLAAMDAAEFDRAMTRAVVLARVSPETKVRAVESLERAGHVVAMTGDGVNDAPALRKAAVGVAMGASGTDVARHAADIVLTDDNFVSIVAAVEEGRIAFRNVQQTTAYLLLTNAGEVATLIAALVLGFPLVLLPAQILWMNLVTDGLPDVALAMERTRGDVLRQPPRPKSAAVVTRRTLVRTFLVAFIMAAGTLSLFAWSSAGGDIIHARSLAFAALALFQLWNVTSMRSETESAFRIGFFSNPFVTAAVAISFVLQVAVMHVPALQRLFGTVPLTLAEWAGLIAFTSLVFVAIEVEKTLLRPRLTATPPVLQ